MLFSIIVPVHNVEKYLDECLNSIIDQVEKLKSECEILLIDDGSTDSSGNICDKYKEKYPSIIKVYHNLNQGLLLTRRYGFKRATGEYIVNCDSDDKLEQGALEKVKNIIKKYHEPDVILFNYYRYDGLNKQIAFQNIFSSQKDCIVKKEEVLREFMLRHSVVSVCCKVFKRTCIDVDRDYSSYGRISTGEDSLQSIEFYSNAKTFVYLNELLYIYRCGSGMTGQFDANYFSTFKTIFEQINNKKTEWNIENFDKLFAVKVLQTAGRAITQSRYKNWKSIKEQKKYLRDILKDEMFANNILYLNDVKGDLQKGHVLLLRLLKNQSLTLICILLKAKNVLGK